MTRHNLKIIKEWVKNYNGLKEMITERENHLNFLQNLSIKTDISRADEKRTKEFISYLKTIKEEDF